MQNQKKPQLDVFKFYQIVAELKKIPGRTYDHLREFNANLMEHMTSLEAPLKDILRMNSMFRERSLNAVQHRITNDFTNEAENENIRKPFETTLADTNFLRVASTIVEWCWNGFLETQKLAQDLQPVQLLLGDKPLHLHDSSSLMKPEVMQRIAHEISMNETRVTNFLVALLELYQFKSRFIKELQKITDFLSSYRELLTHRHGNDGVKIFGNPLVTDLAMCILENVDGHGELQDSADPDSVSVYSRYRAEILIEATQGSQISFFVKDPDTFLTFIFDTCTQLWETITHLEGIFEPLQNNLRNMLNLSRLNMDRVGIADFNSAMDVINMLNPAEVLYRDPGLLLTAAEKARLEHREQTLAGIVELINSNTPKTPKEVVDYILDRKASLSKFEAEDNGFFVCKIGSGNQFKGIAPGALEVIPGLKPNANMDEILGSGFADIRDFFHSIEASVKWRDLFVATSPSKSADKSNVLMIGPAGCGKTELLRAVGADPKSVSIFAVGSDFNTCWMGEASKNPKRLFQAGLKLNKKTNKHVHFLIDEIDAILNNDRQNAGYINLTLEFQVLMDGVVNYPNLSVWGATNHPERIPMPMIRRFSKVAIVGELSREDRISLLKHFTGFMPISGFDDEIWNSLSDKLDGATGDVIRKIVEPVWRDLISGFVRDNPEKAEELIKELNSESRFEVSEFKPKARKVFNRKLGKFISVTPESLETSIDIALGNYAILHEIESAKATYQNAKEFLSAIREEQ